MPPPANSRRRIDDVKKAKGGTRHKTVKEEKRDITRSLKSFGKRSRAS
jgi:hypothetical protein